MRFHPGLFPAKSLLTALLLASVFASSHVLADTADKLSAENAADNAVQQIKESATDSPSEPSNTESANTEPSETESSLEANKAKRTNSLKSKPDKTAAEKTSSGAYIMQLVMSLVVVLLAVAGVYAQSNPRNDLSMFAEMAGYEELEKPEDAPFSVLLPAFVNSELKTAFQIGFMIFIPFLIIDLVVASVLMSMGMMMLSPILISLPFKIMLFVLVAGWSLILGTLASSFYL